jgi:hypothetical protein
VLLFIYIRKGRGIAQGLANLSFIVDERKSFTISTEKYENCAFFDQQMEIN